MERKSNPNYISIIKREAKVSKRIFFIIITFCIAWLPYCILVLFAQFGYNSQKYVTPLSTSLPSMFAKLSAIYNPLFYVITNKDCKKYLRNSIKS